MHAIRIASRGSKLALAQADIVKQSLLGLDPGLDISLVVITTKGDQDSSDFLHQASSVGFFTSEVEKSLLDGVADLAVHSFKDLPTTITSGLKVAAVPKRESPADALVTGKSAVSLADLPIRATVGTSSLRRIAQVRLFRQDLKCVPLRGNVETRLAKVDSGQVDAAIVACAGLIRLGFTRRISVAFPPHEFIPAPAQGALALQIRTDNKPLENLVAQLDHGPSRIAVEAERGILAAMKGGCSIPLGVHAVIKEQTITIHAILSDLEAATYIRRQGTAGVDKAQDLAKEMAEQLLHDGGRDILNQIRSSPLNP